LLALLRSSFLTLDLSGFVFTRAGLDAGNVVNKDPGNDVPREDPANPDKVNPDNEGSRAEPATVARRDPMEVAAPSGTLAMIFLSLFLLRLSLS
jgi:hypothetical protein